MEAVREFAVRRPGGGLASVVPSIAGYRERGVEPTVHAGLPSPGLTFIITLDEPCTVSGHPDPAQPAGSFEVLVGGLHVRPATVVHDGAQSGVQVQLDPLAARAVLGLPAAELVMRDLHGDDVLGRVARRLADQVRGQPDWPGRFAVVEQFLCGALGSAARHAEARPEVAGAWRHLVARRGAVRIDDLAASAGLGARQFADLFRRELGLSPKAAARIARFDATRRRVPQAIAGRQLADLAQAMGYADQAHLTREFREFSGLAPRQWLAAEQAGVLEEDLGNIQDPRPGAA